MMITDSSQELIVGFIEENTLLLNSLDEIMLSAEKSKYLNQKEINEIFRIMHTIKGNSGMMGFEDLANLAHAVEDVFFILRQDPSTLEIVIETIFDLLFQASDFIKGEMDALQNGSEDHPDPQEIIAWLKAVALEMNGQPQAASGLSQNTPASSCNAEPVSEAAAPIPSSEGYHFVRVFFEEDSRMENIRAFMLLTQLKDWCEELDSVPENPENDSGFSKQIAEKGFLVCFKTPIDPEEVLEVIKNAVEVRSLDIIDAAEYGKCGGKALYTAAALPEVSAPSTAVKAEDESDPSSSEKEKQAAAPKLTKQSLISVNQSKLDHLMDLVGEIVTAESIVASNPDLQGMKLDNFTKSIRELRKLTDEIQDVVMSMRMVPLSGTYQKMNRIIRDMCKKLGKTVELETFGGDTEVDKTINDSLADPFMHMIRNSVDHGIESAQERLAMGKPETGKVTISAQNIGGEIVITITDDGRGLNTASLLKKAQENGLLTRPEADYTDREIYNFIMHPGFSTNSQVTEFSGRGVGMDVVRKNIEKVGGTISIDSKLNVGTTFTIKIPLTLAIVDGMEVSVGKTIFTLPIASIVRSFKISEPNQIVYNTDGSEMIMLRGSCHPLVRLHQLFSIDTPVTDLHDGIIILIEYGDRQCCIFADELIGEAQVVVKPFPPFLSKYDIKGYGLSGCTILGDGSISLILDANNLLHTLERQ